MTLQASSEIRQTLLISDRKTNTILLYEIASYTKVSEPLTLAGKMIKHASKPTLLVRLNASAISPVVCMHFSFDAGVILAGSMTGRLAAYPFARTDVSGSSSTHPALTVRNFQGVSASLEPALLENLETEAITLLSMREASPNRCEITSLSRNGYISRHLLDTSSSRWTMATQSKHSITEENLLTVSLHPIYTYIYLGDRSDFDHMLTPLYLPDSEVFNLYYCGPVW